MICIYIYLIKNDIYILHLIIESPRNVQSTPALSIGLRALVWPRNCCDHLTFILSEEVEHVNLCAWFVDQMNMFRFIRVADRWSGCTAIQSAWCERRTHITNLRKLMTHSIPATGIFNYMNSFLKLWYLVSNNDHIQQYKWRIWCPDDSLEALLWTKPAEIVRNGKSCSKSCRCGQASKSQFDTSPFSSAIGCMNDIFTYIWLICTVLHEGRFHNRANSSRMPGLNQPTMFFFGGPFMCRVRWYKRIVLDLLDQCTASKQQLLVQFSVWWQKISI